MKAWIRRMSQAGGGGGEEEGAARRWPVGILRRSGARAARCVLHAKYRGVPPAPAALPLDIDDTVSCFCRCALSLVPLRIRIFLEEKRLNIHSSEAEPMFRCSCRKGPRKRYLGSRYRAVFAT